MYENINIVVKQINSFVWGPILMGLLLGIGMLFVPSPGSADIIYLKNGRSLEGIVEKEDDHSIVLNIGAGTTTLSKSEISRIKRDSAEERSDLEKQWGQKYFSHPEFTPQRFQDIATAFRKLEKSRTSALRSQRQRDDIVSKIELRENVLRDLREEISPYNEKLGQMDPDEDVQSYNEVVSKYNSLANQIQQKSQEVTDFESELKAIDKQIAAYSDSLNAVTYQFKKALKESQAELTEQEKFFLGTLQQELEKMDKDFKAALVDYRQDTAGIMVNVLLNDTVSAGFVVDTGASLVVLGEHIAHRLDIATDQEEYLVPITLGDGRKVNAYPVILRSVKVGDAQVKNVRAAVLVDTTLDIDGLLGMSFLEHFAVKIDGKNKKLILENLGP